MDERTTPVALTAAPAGPPASMTERAYRLLRKDIVHCRLAPGSEVSETDLADRLQMSKTPVREALARLQFDGLVRTMPRRGYQIVPVTITDINELFDLRIVIEQGAIELAAQRITEPELDELERLAHANSLDFLESDIDFHDTVNFRFHTSIARASGNARLHRLAIQQLTELERLYYIEATAEQEYAGTSVTHLALVGHLRRRDPAAARQAIGRHIEASRVVLLDVLTRRNSRLQIR